MKNVLYYDKMSRGAKEKMWHELRDFAVIAFGALFLYFFGIPSLFETAREIQIYRFVVGLSLCLYAGWVLSTQVLLLFGWIERRRKR